MRLNGKVGNFAPLLSDNIPAGWSAALFAQHVGFHEANHRPALAPRVILLPLDGMTDIT